jgi:hypothetical protein
VEKERFMTIQLRDASVWAVRENKLVDKIIKNFEGLEIRRELNCVCKNRADLDYQVKLACG